jgi:hypothetical protein
MCESLIGTMKIEKLNRQPWRTVEDVGAAVFEWIGGSSTSPLGIRSFEEGKSHRRQPLDAIQEADVGRPRQDRELRIRETRHLSHDAAAEEPKHLRHVLGSHDVGVPDDEEHRRVQRPELIGRPPGERLVHFGHLVDQPRPSRRIRRYPLGRLSPGRVVDPIGVRGFLARKHFGV